MGSISLSAHQAIYNESITTKIAHNYLKTFSIPHAPAFDSSLVVTYPLDKKKNGIPHSALQVKLAKSTQCKIILRSIFSEIAAKIESRDADILSYNLWTDLMLFCGPSSNLSHHLLSHINRTSTLLGECALAMLLVTPTSDVQTLSNRQQTIQFFLTQPSCVSNLKQALGSYQEAESRLLSFWTSSDPLYSKEYREYMHKRFFFSQSACK